tara:strand:- start:41 stop:499 length:459 start_codon:yes stop_codon:yes gene_type:complete
MIGRTKSKRLFAINWKISVYWTLEYELHDDDTATIIAHYRDGRPYPSGTERYKLDETDDRVVTHIHTFEEGDMRWQRGDPIATYKVRNPGFVFSYSEIPQVKPNIEHKGDGSGDWFVSTDQRVRGGDGTIHFLGCSDDLPCLICEEREEEGE